MTTHNSLQYWKMSLILLLTVTLCSCGSGQRIDPQLQIISGTVTLDGAPLEHGIVQFYSATPKTNSMVSSTTIRMGEFQLDPKGGLPPGTYKAAISSIKTSGSNSNGSGDKMDAADTAIEVIPSKYNTETELTCEIVPGKPTTVHFELSSDQGRSARK